VRTGNIVDHERGIALFAGQGEIHGASDQRVVESQQRQVFARQCDVAGKRHRLRTLGKAGQGIRGQVLRIEQHDLAAKFFGVNAERFQQALDEGVAARVMILAGKACCSSSACRSRLAASSSR
jgi:hypothetical protein